jgi:hypothetical protein
MLHDHETSIRRINFRKYNFPQYTDLTIRLGVVATGSPEPSGRPIVHTRA